MRNVPKDAHASFSPTRSRSGPVPPWNQSGEGRTKSQQTVFGKNNKGEEKDRSPRTKRAVHTSNRIVEIFAIIIKGTKKEMRRRRSQTGGKMTVMIFELWLGSGVRRMRRKSGARFCRTGLWKLARFLIELIGRLRTLVLSRRFLTRTVWYLLGG